MVTKMVTNMATENKKNAGHFSKAVKMVSLSLLGGAREDQPVLLPSRATCRLSRIFSEILQDRHRPPSDLADRLMRNSSSGQNGSLDGKAVFRSLGGELKGRQPPLHGKLIFSLDITRQAGVVCG
jgi:hypothetical protein